MPTTFRDVDPRDLRVPTSRPSGADPMRLHQQIAQYGSSIIGMPPIEVYELNDGTLEIWDGTKRATRIAKLLQV